MKQKGLTGTDSSLTRAAAILGSCVAAAIIISGIPRAVESAAPAFTTLTPEMRLYAETVNVSGELVLTDQHGSGGLAVTAAVSSADIPRITTGQTARFTLSAYPDEVFAGTVSEIADAPRYRYNGCAKEPVTDIKITPDHADARMRAGLSAEAEILLSEPRDIPVLPCSAIGQDDSGKYVYVYERDTEADSGRAVRRAVQTGAELADGTEIRSGISPDDVVFDMPWKITSGRRIRLSDSA